MPLSGGSTAASQTEDIGPLIPSGPPNAPNLDLPNQPWLTFPLPVALVNTELRTLKFPKFPTHKNGGKFGNLGSSEYSKPKSRPSTASNASLERKRSEGTTGKTTKQSERRRPRVDGSETISHPRHEGKSPFHRPILPTKPLRGSDRDSPDKALERSRTPLSIKPRKSNIDHRSHMTHKSPMGMSVSATRPTGGTVLETTVPTEAQKTCYARRTNRTGLPRPISKSESFACATFEASSLIPASMASDRNLDRAWDSPVGAMLLSRQNTPDRCE